MTRLVLPEPLKKPKRSRLWLSETWPSERQGGISRHGLAGAKKCCCGCTCDTAPNKFNITTAVVISTGCADCGNLNGVYTVTRVTPPNDVRAAADPCYSSSAECTWVSTLPTPVCAEPGPSCDGHSYRLIYLSMLEFGGNTEQIVSFDYYYGGTFTPALAWQRIISSEDSCYGSLPVFGHGGCASCGCVPFQTALPDATCVVSKA